MRAVDRALGSCPRTCGTALSERPSRRPVTLGPHMREASEYSAVLVRDDHSGRVAIVPTIDGRGPD
jgi:hypothetical protein